MAHPGGVTSLQYIKQLIISIAMLLMLQAFPTKRVAQVQMPRGGILPANFGKQGHEQKAGQEEVCPPGLQGFPDDPTPPCPACFCSRCWAEPSLAWLICVNDAVHHRPLICQGLQRGL